MAATGFRPRLLAVCLLIGSHSGLSKAEFPTFCFGSFLGDFTNQPSAILNALQSKNGQLISEVAVLMSDLS